MNPSTIADKLDQVMACTSQNIFCEGLVLNSEGVAILKDLQQRLRWNMTAGDAAKPSAPACMSLREAKLLAALDERDALLELKANIQKRKHAEEKVNNARRRSEVVAAELAAAKAELARLRALKALRNRQNSMNESYQEKSHNYNLRNRPWVNYKC